MGHRHAGPPHAPATRGLVLPRSRLAVGSTRDAHLVRRAAARRADRRAGGWALALLPRTKVRSPARPRARHLAPCPAPRSPRPRAPLSALAGRSRYSPCPPAPLAGARRPRPQAPRMRGRGAGAARARASQAGWCLCAASVRRVHVYCHVNFTNPHTNTHKHTGPRGGKCLELAGLGLSPPSLHSGQVRRARARRASAQLQASCPPSAGQEPSPPLEQKAPAV